MNLEKEILKRANDVGCPKIKYSEMMMGVSLDA